MAEPLTAEGAQFVMSNMDSLTPDEQRIAKNKLREFTETSAPVQEDPLTKWDSQFNQTDDYIANLPEEAQNSIRSAYDVTDDIPALKRNMVNQSYLADRYQKEPSEIAGNSEAYMLDYAQKEWGFEGREISDQEFFNKAQEEVNVELDKRSLHGDVRKMAFLDAIHGEESWEAGGGEALQQIIQAQGYDDADAAKLVESYRNTRTGVAEKLEPYRADLNKIGGLVSEYFSTDMVSTLRSEKEFLSGVMTRADIDKEITPLLDIPEDLVPAAMVYLESIIEKAPQDRGWIESLLDIVGDRMALTGDRASGFFRKRDIDFKEQKLGNSETLWISEDDVSPDMAPADFVNAVSVDSGGRNMRELTLDERYKLQDAIPAARNRLAVERKVFDVAQQKVDPNEEFGEWIEAAELVGNSLGLAGTSIIPIAGIPLVGAAYADEEYDRLIQEHPGMDRDLVTKAALVTGGIMAGVERLEASAIVGKVPGLNKLMSKFAPVSGATGFGGALLTRLGIAGAAEAAEEGIQTIAPAITSELFNAFGVALPEFDWQGALGESADEFMEHPSMFVGLAGMLLPGAAMQAGLDMTAADWAKEADRMVPALSNRDMLELVGTSAADQDAILDESDPQEKLRLFLESEERRDPKIQAEAVEKAKKVIEQVAENQADPEMPTVEAAGPTGAQVRYPGGTVTPAPSLEAAVEMANTGNFNSETLQAVFGYTKGEADLTVEVANAMNIPGLENDMLVRGGRPGSGALDQGAYHGTPHDWAADQPDGTPRPQMQKIGTGEGAQAYGWGLYFAEAREVAEYYRDTLANDKGPLKIWGKPAESIWTEDIKEQFKDEIEAFDGDKDLFEQFLAQLSQVQFMQDAENLFAYDRDLKPIWERFKSDIVEEESVDGKLYKVELPETGDFLDWDAETIQPETLAKIPQADQDALNDFLDENDQAELQDLQGKQVYQLIARAIGDGVLDFTPPDENFDNAHRNASLYLNSIGIPGIRYLDGNSRRKGEGNSNFVIFDESHIDVTDTLYQQDMPVSPGDMSAPPGVKTVSRRTEGTLSLPTYSARKLKGSLPKNILETNPKALFDRLDAANLKISDDPVRLATPSGWVEYMRDAGVSGEILTPPTMIELIANRPAEYVSLVSGGYHGGKTVPGTYESAKSGLDSTVEMRKSIGEKPHEWITAMHHFWGILSRMLPPVQQEAMWLRAIASPGVRNAIQSSIDGEFSLTLNQWKSLIQQARNDINAPGENIGNQGTANANAFYLMLSKWNGKWDQVSNVYATNSSKESGRRFWELGGGVGIKNKVQRFIGLTYGTPGLIMDRWKFVEMWLPSLMGKTGANSTEEYFSYGGTTPSDPEGLYGAYGNIEGNNSALSLAIYEGMETALNQAIINSPELKGFLGDHANLGGLHWHGWNGIKNEAVGHSSLDLSKDLADNYGASINADSIGELLENGTYFTEGSETQTSVVRFSLDRGTPTVTRRDRKADGQQPGAPGGYPGRRAGDVGGGEGTTGQGGPADVAAAPSTLYQAGGKKKASIEFIGDGRAIIRALESPDPSSAIHELFHLARRRMFNREVAPEQRGGVTDWEIDTLEEWLGVTPGEKWSEKQEEQFARAGERYMREGRAPIPGLQTLFDKIGAMFRKVYEKIAGSQIDIEMTPEVQEVFDAWFARGAGNVNQDAVAGADLQSAPGVAAAADVSGAPESGTPSILETAAKEFKERKFWARYRQDERLPEADRQALEPEMYAVIPNKDTDAEARAFLKKVGLLPALEILTDPSISAKDLPPRIRIAAAQQLTLALNKRVKSALRKNTPESLKEVEALREMRDELARGISKIGTAYGQGVQAFAMWAQMSPEGFIKQLKREILGSRLGKGQDVDALFQMEPELEAEVLKLVQQGLDAGQGSWMHQKKIQEALGLMAQAEGLSKADTMTAYWYASILSGVGTQSVNVFGNASNLLGKFAATGLTFRPTDTWAMMMGMFEGTIEGVAVAQEVWTTGSQAIKGGGDKYIYKAAALELLYDPSRSWASPKGFALNTQAAFRHVFRALGSMDAFFWHTAAEGQAHLAARVAARKEGKTVGQMPARISELLSNSTQAQADAMAEAEADMSAFYSPQELAALGEKRRTRQTRMRAWEIRRENRPDFVRNEAKRFGDLATYTNAPEGMMGQFAEVAHSMQRHLIVHTKWGDIPYGRAIVPFIDIVANVADTAMDYSGFGLVRAAKGDRSFFTDKNDVDFEPMSEIERRQRLGATMVGAASAGAVFWLAEKSMEEDEEDPWFAVWGGGPKDSQKKGQLYETGWKPWSFKVGDQYYSYKETPLALVFSMIGGHYDAKRYKSDYSDKSALSKLAYTLSLYPRLLSDMSFLSGMQDVFKIMKGEKSVLDPVVGTAAGLIPGKGLRGDIDKLFYGDIISMRDNDIQAAFYKDIPVIRNFNTRKALNVFGEKVRLEWTGRIPGVRRFVSGEVEDPEFSWLARNRIFIQSYAEGITVDLQRVDTNDKTIMVKLDETTEQRDGRITSGVLTRDERWKFIELVGPRTRELVKQFQQQYGEYPTNRDDVQNKLRYQVTKLREQAELEILLQD